ncbi:MAG TPA: sugar nucleotide-binding protein [Azonexus sp.]|nr:sugar nucleotide-binding protein [Azonexus sp.]
MTPSVLVLGATGTLGPHLVAAARRRSIGVLATARQAAPQCLAFTLGRDAPGAWLDSLPGRPAAALICAAESGIDRCRTDPAAAAINGEATCELIAALVDRGILPVFYSTDLVFAGQPGEAPGGYRESDPCCPGTAYGRQKLAAETMLRSLGNEHLILRLAKLYAGNADDHSPLAQWCQAFARRQPVRCATDQWLTPTWAGDVAEITFRLLETGCRGTLHVAATESYTRYDLARRMAENWGFDPALVEACSIADFAFAEPRPPDNRLNTDALRARLDFRFRQVSCLPSDLTFA